MLPQSYLNYKTVHRRFQNVVQQRGLSRRAGRKFAQVERRFEPRSKAANPPTIGDRKVHTTATNKFLA
jgi:hypothetical protein